MKTSLKFISQLIVLKTQLMNQALADSENLCTTSIVTSFDSIAPDKATDGIIPSNCGSGGTICQSTANGATSSNG